MSEEEDQQSTQMRISDTDAFLKVFTSKHVSYKLCPKEWVITDWGFGVDITCCGGDCQPIAMKDIRKLAHGANDKEMFVNWASILGKAHNSTLDEIP